MAINLKLKMKNKSISVKLFVLTALFFLVFTSITMVLQSVFIEKFYMNRKEKNFERNFEAFKKSYDQSPADDDITSAMSSFQINNNAKIGLYNTATHKYYATPDNNTDALGVSNSSEDVSYAGTITSAIREWQSNAEYLRLTRSGKTVVFNSDKKYKGISTIVGVTPIVEDNTITSVFIAISSLQPVGEASSIIREFYIYFYILAIFLIVVLSLFYTNMISKPLKKLNNTALKMSQLDFTEKCDVTTDDEIGNLASTLNFLSNNLSTSLNELKDANEKLTEDIEKEKTLEKMRKEFVAGVSHELKTPIALINGYAEGLKDNIAEGEEKDYYLDVIMDESQKMSLLISDMLDLSQLESGNFKLEQLEFNIEELINSIIKKLTNIFEEKKIKIEVLIKATNTEVFGDSFRIEQVLNNLLGNAIKNTPTEGFINVSLKEINNIILIEIENQGQQIPEKELQNIWEKFYKVEKSRNRDLGGTGIGLSIVKNILNLHESSFGVENTELGVKFFFDIKLAVDKL